MIRDEWAVYALFVFAIMAGQVGRLGRKLERGYAIGRRDILIEMTMLPAFGALGGSLAIEWEWPRWTILGVGIAAGWLGFLTFRFVVGIFRTMIGQLRTDIGKDSE